MSVIGRLREHPKAFLYAHGTTVMVASVYESSPPITVLGGVLILATAWYVHTDREQEDS